MEKRERKEKKKSMNVIDLLVLLIVGAVVIGLVLKTTGLLGGIQEEKQVGASIVYTVKLENIDKDLYQTIKRYIDQAKSEGLPGEQMMSNGKMVEDAYIVDVTAKDREEVFEFYGDDNYLSLSPAKRGRVDMLFKLQAHADNYIISQVGSQEVRPGRGHIVKSIHFEVSGIITDCSWTLDSTSDGAASPSASATPTPTSTPTPTPSESPTPSATDSATPTPSGSAAAR